MIKVDSKQTTLQMTGSKTEAVACSWLLVAPEGKKLTLDVTNVTLAHIDDIASVVDAGTRFLRLIDIKERRLGKALNSHIIFEEVHSIGNAINDARGLT